MTSLLIDSFDAACEEFSADRVVADSDMNRRFIDECRKRGLSKPVAQLNRSLLNARKRGLLAGRKRAKRTHFSNEVDYRFASEMSVRFLERRDGISLDAIICDPEKAQEFDEYCETLCPGIPRCNIDGQH